MLILYSYFPLTCSSSLIDSLSWWCINNSVCSGLDFDLGNQQLWQLGLSNLEVILPFGLSCSFFGDRLCTLDLRISTQRPLVIHFTQVELLLQLSLEGWFLDWRLLTSVVPWGSVLGSLLFVIYECSGWECIRHGEVCQQYWNLWDYTQWWIAVRS